MNPYGQYDAERLAAGLKELRLKEDKTPSFAYSNLGFGLLGEALAHRAGMTYGELVRTRIAEPLKLPDTTVNPSMEQLERMASGHSSQREPLPRWTFQTLHGCGAILSTPGDMLALQQAFCDRADTPLRPAMNLTIARQRAAFPGNNVGLSWFIRDIGERKVYWHNGGTTGFKMCNAFCQDPPVAVVILCNTGSDAQDDGREFYRLGDVFIRQLIAEDD
ncbi:MAG: serine hydrolase domain-containing protein [Planctomycetaceae bacterium]